MAIHDPADATAGEPATAGVEEDRPVRGGGRQRTQVGIEGAQGMAPQRHDPLLPPLAQHPHQPAVQVETGDIQAGQLRNAQSRRIEQLQDRAVAQGKCLRPIRRLHQGGHLVDGEMVRNPLLPLGGADEFCRVPFHQPLADKVAVAGADGCQLAANGATHLPFHEPGEIAPDQQVIHRCSSRGSAPFLADEVEKLVQVGTVGGQGMGGNVAFGGEVDKKALDGGLHGGYPVSRCRSTKSRNSFMRTMASPSPMISRNSIPTPGG